MSYAPVLTAPQIDRIRPFAKPRQVAEGEVLYQPDDDTPPVFLVLSGAIRILTVMAGEERPVTTYSTGQFSGELLMIAGRRFFCSVRCPKASWRFSRRGIRSPRWVR